MEVFRKEFICQKFEAHNHTEETLFAMTGGILIPFAKPGKFTEDEIHIFYIPKGGRNLLQTGRLALGTVYTGRIGDVYGHL